MHVMLGGGDQLYCDGLAKSSKLFRAWLRISNLHHKFSTPYTEELKNEVEEFYLEQYCTVYNFVPTALTRSGFIKDNLAMVCRPDASLIKANAQIPMVNIYDDHDIIDGFGSYPHHFMRCAVFSNLGRAAFKYYLLFQHQSTVAEGPTLESWDNSIVLGPKPGPYMNELSRSIVCWLGTDVLFLGTILKEVV
jgi:PhoD related phosphatase